MTAVSIRLPRSGVVLRPVSDAPNCREFILGDWEMGLRRFGEGAVGVEFWTVKNAGGCYAGTEAGAIARLDSRVLALRAALGFDAERERAVRECAEIAMATKKRAEDICDKSGHGYTCGCDMAATAAGIADEILSLLPAPEKKDVPCRRGDRGCGETPCVCGTTKED